MKEAIQAKLRASQPLARAIVAVVCAFTLVCGISMPQLALASERGGVL